MHLPDSILSALHAPFLLDGPAMQSFMLQVVQVLTGKTKVEDITQARSRAPHHAYTPHAAALGTQGYQSLDEVPAGSIAVHQVIGVMLPDDSWFGLGTRSMSQAILAADAHPNIIGHVGWFNTPGGSTMGLEDFAGTIASTNKPFVGYAQQACSAGVWSICGADSIVLAGRTAMMGSIGTKAEFLDFSGMFEQMGIKQISVLATKSVNKTKSFDEAIAGNHKPLQAEILDPLNEVFLDTVLECRGDKIPVKQQAEVLSGLVFIGQSCLDKGLADSFGSFDDAVQLAQQLAGASPSAPSSTTSSTMGIFGTKTALPAAMLALVGADAVTPEQATAANAELKAGGITGAMLVPAANYQELQTKAGAYDAALQAQAAAEGKLTAMTDALTTAGAADVPALAKDRDEWKTKAEAFGSQPGSMGTSAKKDADDMGEPSAASANQKAIDSLAHNAALDNHPLFGGK